MKFEKNTLESLLENERIKPAMLSLWFLLIRIQPYIFNIAKLPVEWLLHSVGHLLGVSIERRLTCAS